LANIAGVFRSVSLVASITLMATPAFAASGDLFEGMTSQIPDPVPVTDQLTIGSPIQEGGITIFPIIDSGAEKLQPEDTLVSLPEALRDGTLTVNEQGHGATVARLWVHNTGKQPVLVMSGELLHGGSQDRVITRDVIIPPTQRPIAVNVNCVEQGRWDSATRGHTFAYGGRAELGLRRVVQVERDQGATWRAVSQLNGAKLRRLAAYGVHDASLAPSTGTYMASVNSLVVDRQVDKVADEVMDRLDKVHGAVGVVVAFNGRMVASELYGHPGLFQGVSRATIEAVARDGLTTGVIYGDAARPSNAVAAAFLSDALGEGMVADGFDAGEDTWSYVTHDLDGRVVHFESYRR